MVQLVTATTACVIVADATGDIISFSNAIFRLHQENY